MKWVYKHFDELSTRELYEILRLRAKVFVVEQNCPYQDCDKKDMAGIHLMGYVDNKVVAYLRVLPQNISYEEVSLGRVVVDPTYRKNHYGDALLAKGIAVAREVYQAEQIRISAQNYLRNYYQKAGFVIQSEIYLEDNIPHVEMLLHCVQY